MEQQALHIVELVIPVYNESDSIDSFHKQVTAVIDRLPYDFLITYINDGSSDDTQQKLLNLLVNDTRVKVVELSRNFGHQAALSAGLDLSQADVVITMDGDGEHPPSLIKEMLEAAETGIDIVIAQRQQDQNASFFKRWTSQVFYRLINRMGDTHIQPGAADFRLMTRPALDSLRKFSEYHRFLRGMVAWMGFRHLIIPYTPSNRIAGSSKYSLKKMFTLAFNAIFSFSLIPLYFSISLGGLFLLLALIEAIYVISFWISGQQSGLEPGWSSLMFVLLIIGGTIMVSLGFIGIYIGYIFQEVKRRPVYLIRQITASQLRNGNENA